ncbi:hypothetical protein HDA40_006206 [Hamadaea flava]|uniref:Uncharacterized protein n=1 Tax=Hamadaea flava TaxID=1742688 RepID=A0ABV8LUM9_9ACTN|nr:hypothetical protein [Hamadaea flava]MCP2327699.1 hypothetical protein [Hamadaea flava]
MNWLGFALAAVFTLFPGFDDGGALVGLGLRVRACAVGEAGGVLARTAVH